MEKNEKTTSLEGSSVQRVHKTTKWERATVASSIIFLMVLGISSFFPKERLWGINHLSYYPLWLRVVLISLGFLVFIPLVNQTLRGLLKKSLIPVFSFLVEKRKYLGYSVIILLFIAFFYLFRTRTHFLGDGASLISYMNSGTLSVKWSQPLAYQIYLSAYDFLNGLFHLDGASVYALISYLSGALFVFFALRLADLLGKTASTKLFVFLALTFMGGIQLFMGYAEHYPLLYSVTLIYLFYSIKCLKGETNLLLPLLIFFVLLPIHFFSFCLLPSAILLFLYAGRDGKTMSVFKTKRIWLVFPVLISIFVFLIIYFWKYGWHSSGYFVPLLKARHYAPEHTFFSSPHLLDFINQQLLVSPVGFLLFVVFLISKPGNSNSKDKIYRFLLMVSISQLLLNFVMDPGLGAARDWDLFASTGIGYTILALYVFAKALPNSKTGYLKLGLTVIVLISSLPWMGINVKPDLSVARFRNLLDLDPKRSLSGHYVLADYFESLGKPEEANREREKQRRKCPECELVNSGLKLLKEGRLEQASFNFSQALQIAPNFPEAHCALGEYYLRARNLEKAEIELMKAIDLRPGYGDAYAHLGVVYALRKETQRALSMVERALVLGAVRAEVYHDLGNILLQAQNLDEAIRAYRKAIQMSDKSAEPHLGLASALFRQGKLQESLKEVNRALQINPEFAPAYYRLGIVYQALGMREESMTALKRYLRLAPKGPLAQRARELLEDLENQ